MKKYKYKIKGIDCAACSKKIEEMLSKKQDFRHVNLNFALETLSFEAPEDLSKQDLIKTIKKIEPSVSLEEEKLSTSSSTYYLLLGVILFGISYFLSGPLKASFIFCSYLVLLWTTLKKAFLNLKSKIINENLLIVLSAIGAYLLGEFQEGFMVVFLYEIGKILEDKAILKSRKSIASLMDLQAPIAHVVKQGKYEDILPDKVSIGSTLLVKKGEKIPVDGLLLDDLIEVDTKSLTGESAYKIKKKGDTLLSGMINMSDPFLMKTTKKYENSTASRILELVDNASEKKTVSETFVTKASQIYTPIILGLALLIAIFAPLFTSLSYRKSIYHALIFIVISCPCSIVISIPLAYFTGIGVSSRRGVLVKGSVYLDIFRKIKRVVFDKTGTLTTGEFQVTEVIETEKFKKKDILFYACLGESFSTHPIAQALLNQNKKKLPTEDVHNLKEFPGKGLSYVYKNKIIKVGNDKLVKGPLKRKETILYVSIDDQYIGAILLEDTLRDDAVKTVLALNKAGIETWMFTGDREEVAKKVAKKLKLTSYRAELLPEDKYKELENLLEDGKLTSYIGDGINDSPVLKRSDVGISMGGVGSSAAIEASDIVFMEDKLAKILDGISLSQLVNHIVVENLVFSLFVKIATLILSLLGFVSMWQAVFADVGVTIITIFNTFRILRRK